MKMGQSTEKVVIAVEKKVASFVDIVSENSEKNLQRFCVTGFHQKSKFLKGITLWGLLFVFLFALLGVASIWILKSELKQLGDRIEQIGFSERAVVSVWSVAENLQKQSKLIVQSALITVDQTVEKENIFSLGGFAFELGTSNLRMVAMGNKVQYYLPLNEIDISDINWNGETKILKVMCPLPVVDADMVEVQNDPRYILFLGNNCWFDWAKGGAQSELTAQAKESLREYVLRAAKTNYHISMAKENARHELYCFLSALLSPIEPDIHIVLEFKK